MPAERTRTDVDPRDRWRLDALFDDVEAWDAACDEVAALAAELDAVEDPLADGETLRDVLRRYEDLKIAEERVSTHAEVQFLVDTRDGETRDRYGRRDAVEARVAAVESDLETAIRRADADAVRRLVAETPDLDRYEHYLEDHLRRADHVRSAAIESVLTDLADVVDAPADVYLALRNGDLAFPTVEDPDGAQETVTLNNYTHLLESRDRGFRRRIFEAFYDELAAHRRAIGAAFEANLRSHVRLADVRNHESALHARLHEDDVPVAVYETLVETVRDGLDPLHRHLRLKADSLGVETLRPWDLEPRLAGESPPMPYDEACEHVLDAVSPLGDAYRERLREGLASNWVDVHETVGKADGAFTIPTYAGQPFVLLNWQPNLYYSFGLAHELGHAMHADLASDAQPFVYGYADRAISEVPSTVNEVLYVRHLLDTATDPTFRRAVLDAWLERFRDLLYRRTRYAALERRLHDLAADGDGLSPERLDAVTGELRAEFEAPVDPGEDDRWAGEWMHVPYLCHTQDHYFVYQYATSFAAALAIVDDIEREGEPAAARYREFLHVGSSAPPRDLLADLGVDPTDPATVERAIARYRERLDQMAALL